MTTKVKEALHELIQSLSKSEKRYFKLYASRHAIGGETNSLRLFDYLENEASYDEEKLFSHFKNEPFLKQFSITKKRLYDQILHALDAFHTPTSDSAQLYKMLHAAEILFEKALYKQCRRILISVEKQAEKLHKDEILLIVFELKRKLIETDGSPDKTTESLIHIRQDYKSAIENLNHIQDLWLLKTELFHEIQQSGVARDEENVQNYTKLIAGLKSEKHYSKNIKAQYLYYHLLSAYHYVIQDNISSLKHLQTNIDLCRKHPVFVSEEAQKYISVLTNAIYLSESIGDHKLALQYLAEMKELSKTIQLTDTNEIKLFSSVTSIELSLLIRSGDFQQALKIQPEIQQKFLQYNDKLNPTRKSFISYKIAVIYLAQGRLSEALRWINSILCDHSQDQNEDIVGFSQLLSLLIHIELENEEYLPYCLKNVRRFFKTRKRLHEFELLIINFTSKWLRKKDPIERLDLWEELHETLNKMISQSTYNTVIRDFFDFYAWVEAKIKRKPFDLIVREQYRHQLMQAS